MVFNERRAHAAIFPVVHTTWDIFLTCFLIFFSDESFENLFVKYDFFKIDQLRCYHQLLLWSFLASSMGFFYDYLHTFSLRKMRISA